MTDRSPLLFEKFIYDFLVVPEPPVTPPPPLPPPPAGSDSHNYLYHIFNNQIEQLSRLTDAVHAKNLKSEIALRGHCLYEHLSGDEYDTDEEEDDDVGEEDGVAYTIHQDHNYFEEEPFYPPGMDDEDYVRNALTSPGLHDDYDSTTESEPPSNQQTPTSFTHAQNFASPQGLITQWTAEQCAEFFTNLGLDQYADAVVDEFIDGEALIAISHADLKDMGVNSVGHRLTILKSVYQVKLKQSVPIEPDHYVPPSADANAPDAHATQDDIARIIYQIRLRDERMMAAEMELRTVAEQLFRLQEEQRKFREDVLPAIRMVKNQNQALPTPINGSMPQFSSDQQHPHSTMNQTSPRNANFPPEQSQKSGGLTRKGSLKKFWNHKIPSPTIHEIGGGLEPSAAATQASNHLTASMNSNSSAPSPHPNQQPSPTSPPPTLSTPQIGLNTRVPPVQQQPASARIERDHTDWQNFNEKAPPMSAHPLNPGQLRKIGGSTTNINTNHSQNNNNPTGPTGSTPTNPNPPSGGSANDDASTFMKSFRVSMEEPCHKVLPMALKKYKIEDDWRAYSLYIVHGDQERCLGLEERPLILFKQLASEGKKPMFMLRKHATPIEGFANTRRPTTSTNLADSADNNVSTTGLHVPGSAGFGGSVSPPGGIGSARQSMVNGVQLPGGVL